MCILFFHFDPAHPRYIFIVASNRDEWYDRPTETVSFWGDRPLICAGTCSSNAAQYCSCVYAKALAVLFSLTHVR